MTEPSQMALVASEALYDAQIAAGGVSIFECRAAFAAFESQIRADQKERDIIAVRDAMVAMEWPPQDGDRQIDEVIAAIRGTKCPDCDGQGWHVSSETECCNNAEWECGAVGCTGPIEKHVQTGCERCSGTGLLCAQKRELP